MRIVPWLFCLAPLACGSQAGAPPAAPVTQTREADAPPAAVPVPDLRSRKTGSDWPGFLGPMGTSVSPENGILAPWPREGPRLVWQMRVGAGYGMPSISQGRLFQFDRHGDQERLT